MLLNPSHINNADFSQAASTAIQIALVDLLRSWGIESMAVVGHSSGKVAAAYATGILSLHRRPRTRPLDRSGALLLHWEIIPAEIQGPEVRQIGHSRKGFGQCHVQKGGCRCRSLTLCLCFLP